MAKRQRDDLASFLFDVALVLVLIALVLIIGSIILQYLTKERKAATFCDTTLSCTVRLGSILNPVWYEYDSANGEERLRMNGETYRINQYRGDNPAIEFLIIRKEGPKGPEIVNDLSSDARRWYGLGREAKNGKLRELAEPEGELPPSTKR